MVFDEHDDLEDEEEEEEEGEEMVTAAARTRRKSGINSSSSTAVGQVRYRECLKDKAVGIGGHAMDGCTEFMAAGEEGSLEALECAACNCYRNFHRKEAEGGGPMMILYHPSPPPPPPPHQPPQFSLYRAPAPPARYLHRTPLALPGREEEDVSNPSSRGGGGGGRGNSSRNNNSGGGKRRFRTKFTAEQKEMLRRFSERECS